MPITPAARGSWLGLCHGLAGCPPSPLTWWHPVLVAVVGPLPVGVVRCAPALGLGRTAGACHNRVNSQGGDPRTARGLCPTLNSQGRDPSTRRGLGPPPALFLLSPSNYLSCVPCAMARAAHPLCYPASQHSCRGMDGWPLPVESKLSPSRRAVLFTEVKDYQSGWATSVRC